MTERRAWRRAVYEVIQTMTSSLPQGQVTIERLCRLAGRHRCAALLGGVGGALPLRADRRPVVLPGRRVVGPLERV